MAAAIECDDPFVVGATHVLESYSDYGQLIGCLREAEVPTITKASSRGEMLAVGTAVKGSAGYVAMEQVTGTLNASSGTFALQHTGTMTRGTPQLSVTVVPDSGTGQLVGLAGKMTINIVDGKHLYDFEYTITEAQ